MPQKRPEDLFRDHLELRIKGTGVTETQLIIRIFALTPVVIIPFPDV
jgi:hypothetical protein